MVAALHLLVFYDAIESGMFVCAYQLHPANLSFMFFALYLLLLNFNKLFA